MSDTTITIPKPNFRTIIIPNVKAGQLYREEQARYVIRSLRVVHQELTDKEPVETRAFVQIKKEDSSRVYTTMVNALSDGEMRHQVIYKAHKALISAKRELREIGELTEAIDLIDQALERVDFVLKREEKRISEDEHQSN